MPRAGQLRAFFLRVGMLFVAFLAAALYVVVGALVVMFLSGSLHILGHEYPGIKTGLLTAAAVAVVAVVTLLFSVRTFLKVYKSLRDNAAKYTPT